MYPYYSRLLHGALSPSLHSLEVHGSLEASSTMTERHPDTERPELVGAWVDGTYYMGETDGNSEEWIAAEATVEIEDAT
jgi:hypothetical protein